MNLETLAQLLERRLQVIADHELRRLNPEEQLHQLQVVSESIAAAHRGLQARIDARLNHYLTQASYQKALDRIRELEASQAG